MDLGLEIPNFVLEREIGRGGMSRVFLGRQLEPKREVAIKVVAPAAAGDENFLQSLKQEGDTVASLSHDNVVTVYSCGVVRGHYYLAMEILSGGDLVQKIKRGLKPEESVDILSQVASALEHAHKRGILHRDIKPENIMFHESGKAVLVDFGIAKAMESTSSFTRVGAVVGTPHYMSPERCQGKPIDARSDIYALGVLFWEMLTGKKLYDGRDTVAVTYAHVFEPIPPLPPEFARFQPLMSKLLAKNPDDRLQSAGQLVHALAKFRSPGIAAREFETRKVGAFDVLPAPAARAIQSPKLWIGLATGALIALAAGWWFSRPEPARVTFRELSSEEMLRMRDLLAAGEVQFRMNNTDIAEANFIKVLEEYDCRNDEARRSLQMLNPTKLTTIVEACPGP